MNQRKLYYNAMIKQTMLYASTVWTSFSVENIRKVLQKRAARVILGADTKANSVKLFKQLRWVPFFHEARINKLILVYKRIFGECPPYLTQILVRKVDVNGRSSRHGHLNLICPRFKRETEGGRSFSGICCLPILKTSLLLQALKNQFSNILWTVVRNWTILSSNFSISPFLLLVFTNASHSFLIFIFLVIIARFKTLFIFLTSNILSFFCTFYMRATSLSVITVVCYL